MDKRFEMLETKIAYHDKELAELHEVIYRQQLVIDRVEAQLTQVTAQLKSLGFEGDPQKDQQPPHY